MAVQRGQLSVEFLQIWWKSFLGPGVKFFKNSKTSNHQNEVLLPWNRHPGQDIVYVLPWSIEILLSQRFAKVPESWWISKPAQNLLAVPQACMQFYKLAFPWQSVWAVHKNLILNYWNFFYLGLHCMFVKRLTFIITCVSLHCRINFNFRLKDIEI